MFTKILYLKYTSISKISIENTFLKTLSYILKNRRRSHTVRHNFKNECNDLEISLGMNISI